jgi:putative glutamine amidotransferase
VNCDVEGAGGLARERLFLYTDPLDALLEAGAAPVLLPPAPDSPGLAREILAGVDGVLLTGGDDYLAAIADPDRPPPDFTPIHPRRERADLELGRAVLERDLPVLAICAGFQLLVLLEGGRIIGDIPTELDGRVRHRRSSPEEAAPEHELERLDPGRADLPELPAAVPSHHHQGIGELPRGWRTWASAPDGVIEAAVGPGRFQVGVQWHPELAPRAPAARALFRALVRAAGGGGR